MQIKCLHCGEQVEWEGTGTPPTYCSLPCKRKSKQRRRKERVKAQKQDALVECPTPEKLQFRREAKIKRYARNVGLRYYICQCGQWHLTSKGTERGKRKIALKRPLQVIRWQNEMVMVFNTFGEQIRELQGSYDHVKEDVLKASNSRTVFYHGTWRTGERYEVTKEEW